MGGATTRWGAVLAAVAVSTTTRPTTTTTHGFVGGPVVVPISLRGRRGGSHAQNAGVSSPRRRRQRTTTTVCGQQGGVEEVGRAVTDLTGTLGALLTNATATWVNGGWQVRKRAGRWLPEFTPAGWNSATSSYDDDALPGGAAAIVRDPAPLSAATQAQAWLASDAGSRALTSPALGEVEREAAVASEFTKLLKRSPEMNALCVRQTDGSIVFPDEASLARAAAFFAVHVTKELGAAARALARYVDDLEVELAAADEAAVRLRGDVRDAEAALDEKAKLAETALAQAEALRAETTALRSDLEDQTRAAKAYEKKALEASRTIADVERRSQSSETELQSAVSAAASLEQ
eukprot:CAMPEP_0185693172 /NCGR_PEP_ID=MMETSP1164-20130828/3044_1 /TAXON_ID=1104430 /ORGANISM="Chrysoreinhardia sp, Strain CCMP2950" /LENGTH=347 /DNA_ID=CAMNT_0028359939 /DNA_START=45 /DNA_END=1085 /DNA_ORIENTATION=-